MTCLVGGKRKNLFGSTSWMNTLVASTNFVVGSTPDKNTSTDPLGPRTTFETQNITVENCEEALGAEEEICESKP